MFRILAWAMTALAALVSQTAYAQARADGPGNAATATAISQAADACRSLEGGRFTQMPSAPTWVVKATFNAAKDGRAAFCAIEGYVNPTVNFGLYLPVGNWNGRFLMRGCGGSCGSVQTELACGDHQRAGYACVFTDMGHRSTLSDNNWTANNLQGLVDFGYRSTHVTVLAGKAIAKAFYASDPMKSYYFACSTGGRQGMVEVQRFPEDFDGVVAMAPASMGPYGSGGLAGITALMNLNRDAAGNQILPNRKALLVHRAVVKDCDLNDGVKDGLIGDPRRCGFKPEDLRCKTTDTSNCLTDAQVGVVNAFYARRGASKGSEFNWIGAFIANARLPGEPAAALPDLAQGRGDPAIVDSLNNPSYPDLRPFEAHGGKLIMVHGWDDPSVMPPPTIDYYETMTRTMGGPVPTRQFARLFMIPGMDHCSGGSGAYAIDYMTAITDWVEHDKAPDALKGIHPKPGAPLDFFSVRLPQLDPKWIAFSRTHPAYPATGKGGDVPPVVPAGSLSQELGDAVERADREATAAFFPRRNVMNAISQAMWQTFYHHDATLAEQEAALATVKASRPLTPVATEAVERMKAELALN
ncbi:tannase/feruloyl esterase family alpha/beta hydrolase [Sphingomonas immobilis]|uniref:Tannase/feruloyl esterase family alpha/beta hydrolase n=1 Tax=Sphingomonas immobilis TaxID=3063997 RepID=A0ABT9A0N9_9SPHN|nr:tannase/feruloyl esterase family alpha/beta hydrolase [Sphingomonas sp. CA1-15]MDO7843398.1 tannase/feruloyl esterase family alpha/beta hydrolase [Sphingomonas sp. CA1-15]